MTIPMLAFVHARLEITDPALFELEAVALICDPA